MTELLKPGYEIITNHEMLHECDGMNRVIDMQWARYLLTFDHDHFDVIGFNPNIYPIHVASLITDNMRLAEAKSGDKDHEKLSYRIGAQGFGAEDAQPLASLGKP